MRRAALAPALLALLLVPGSASADEFDVGVSAVGLVNGSFIDEPSEGDKFATRPDGNRRPVLYPGFAGVGGGAGVTVIGSWRGILGLETGVHYTVEKGAGDINGQAVELSNRSVHVPLLLRISAPLPAISPFLFVGPEFVIPTKTEADMDTTELAELAGAGVSAQADPYTTLAFGLGFEIKLPTGPLDFRIPFVLKGALTPGFDETADGRLDCLNAACTQVRFDTTWQYQASVNIGLAYYFL